MRLISCHQVILHLSSNLWVEANWLVSPLSETDSAASPLICWLVEAGPYRAHWTIASIRTGVVKVTPSELLRYTTRPSSLLSIEVSIQTAWTRPLLSTAIDGL